MTNQQSIYDICDVAEDILQCIEKHTSMSERLTQHPEVLKFIDKDGYSFLEIALNRGCQSHNVDAILKIAPGLAARPFEGRLPFFRLLDKCKVDDDSAKYEDHCHSLLKLLQAHPETAAQFDCGMLPLRRLLEDQQTSTHAFSEPMVLLLKWLLRHYSHAAFVEVDGELPLHMALYPFMPPEGIQMLIVANPEAVGHLSKAGHRPIFTALERDLSPPVVIKLIEAYPAALAERVPGLGLLPLEYAVKLGVKEEVLDILLKGGTGEIPKTVAYATAGIDGMVARDSFERPKSQHEVLHEFEVITRLRIAGSQSLLAIRIIPYQSDCFTVHMPKSALVEDLRSMLWLMEGTKPEHQKIIDSSGHRLLEGEVLSKAITSPEPDSQMPTSADQANRWRLHKFYLQGNRCLDSKSNSGCHLLT